MDKGTKVPLIVDPDSAFLGSLIKETESRTIIPIVASGTQQAIDILVMKQSSVSILIVSTAFPREEVLNTVYSAHRAVPGLPIALLVTDGIVLFNDDELQKMRVQTILKKPITFSGIMGQLISLAPIPRESSKQADQDFAPIEIERKTALERVSEDVYVRIRGDRYIKVLRAGYSLGVERLDRYMRRGIKSFYRSKK